MANPDANRRDLALLVPAVCLTHTPTRSSRRSPAMSELSQRANDPVFKGRDEGPNVAAAAPKIEHDIGHALARSMIGELAAAP